METKKVGQFCEDLTINLALDTIEIGKQALVFANTKSSAEKTAEDIASKIKKNDEKLDELAKKISNVLTHPTKQCLRLAVCLKKGIAFHHAGLTHNQKEMIEDGFREGTIKVICCTPTLAFGLDLPAFRAIMKDLKRFGHRGLDWIPTLEYMQMAGRAGRPKFDSYGEAICIAKSDAAERDILDRYIKGEPEEIFSKLAVEPALRTYILSLIATNFVNDEKSLIDFFSRTFWAYQYKDMRQLSAIIRKMTDLLEKYEFIFSSGKSDFVSASEIEEIGYDATPIGKRVAELYIDPFTANDIVIALKKGAENSVNAFSLLQLISYTLEMRPLLNVRVKEYDTVTEELIKQEENIITEEPDQYEPEYQDFINSVKTAMFFSEWISEKDEEYLLEKYNIRPGEIRVKLETADWLLYASEELARMLNLKEIIKEIIKLRLRIKYGVKEELLALLKLEGIGRVRARKLYDFGIKDIGAVKKATIADLTQLIGQKTALSVKKQVGQEVEAVKKGTRKGQTSIEKF